MITVASRPGPLLVTGASGCLGSRLARLARDCGWSVVGTGLRAPARIDGVDGRQLDVRDFDAVRALVRDVRPAAVAHTAYRATDWATNADGAAHVAAAAAEADARLVHVSSDAVFPGAPTPYDESAAPAPVNAYGAAKAAAEVAVRALAPGAAIVRTSLIVGDERSGQHTLTLEMAAGDREGVLFTDEIRCPVLVDDLAAALLELVTTDFAGLLNVAGPQSMSRHELGRLIAVWHGVDPDLVPAGLIADSGLARPGDVRLDTALARRTLRKRPRPVTDVLTTPLTALS